MHPILTNSDQVGLRPGRPALLLKDALPRVCGHLFTYRMSIVSTSTSLANLCSRSLLNQLTDTLPNSYQASWKLGQRPMDRDSVVGGCSPDDPSRSLWLPGPPDRAEHWSPASREGRAGPHGVRACFRLGAHQRLRKPLRLASIPWHLLMLK